MQCSKSRAQTDKPLKFMDKPLKLMDKPPIPSAPAHSIFGAEPTKSPGPWRKDNKEMGVFRDRS